MNCDTESVNQPQDKDLSDTTTKFKTLGLKRSKMIELVQKLRTELNQTQIIEKLWDVKKGGSDDWKKAHEEFKDLIGD
jgi:hypothetical protein